MKLKEAIKMSATEALIFTAATYIGVWLAIEIFALIPGMKEIMEENPIVVIPEPIEKFSEGVEFAISISSIFVIYFITLIFTKMEL